MRYFNLIGILFAAFLIGGCTSFYQKSEALVTGKEVSAFMEDGVVPINRPLIYDIVQSLYADGYEHGEFAESIEDEEYFDALKIETRQEYDREYRVASVACEAVYDRKVNEYKIQSLVGGVAFAGFMPHSKAGRAMDGCLLERGWEAGTQRMYDQIFDLAWKKAKRSKR